MKNITSIAITILSLGILSTQAQTTVFFDDFTSGINDGYSVPSGGGTVTVETSGTGLNGNALLLSTTSNNRFALKSFSEVTLTDIGDYIELSLDYRFTAALDDNFGSEISFEGIADAGIRFNPSAATNGGTYFTDADSNAGRFDTIASGTTGQSMFVRITKTSATEVTITSTFNGNAHDDSNLQIIGTEISTPLSFSNIRIGWTSGNSGDIYYDNIGVTTNAIIPEPTTYVAIIGLVGLIGTAAFRRYRA